MSFGDYSTTPNNNGTIGGLDLSEGCSPANLNNAVRQLAADGRELFNTVDAIDISSKANITSPVFNGTPIYQARGGLLHNNSPASSNGRVYTQSAGQGLPTLFNGDWVLTY